MIDNSNSNNGSNKRDSDSNNNDCKIISRRYMDKRRQLRREGQDNRKSSKEREREAIEQLRQWLSLDEIRRDLHMTRSMFRRLVIRLI